MSSRDRVKISDEGREEEEAEHRRSRLWIGYSEDNLQRIHDSQRRRTQSPRQENIVPSSPDVESSRRPTFQRGQGQSPQQENRVSSSPDVETSRRPTSQRGQGQSPQQENIVPSSPDVESSRTYKSQRRQTQSPQRKSTPPSSPTIGSRMKRSEPSEEYTVPDDFDNLDEVVAPSPIDTRGEQDQDHLEDRDTHPSTWEDRDEPQNFENLDELADPPPLAKGQEERKQGYLEDRDGETNQADEFGNFDQVVAPGPVDQPLSKSPSTDNGEVKKESPTPHNRVTILATEIYTISYLILFSIFGTLARLGLQALTFYPGAPVQTGLLWANVGGSFIMGFLSEDQRLFRDEQTIAPPRFSKDEEKGDHDERRQAADQKHASFKKTLPLYIGLATGFCGSFTSFSSFIRDAFFALSNALPVPVQHPSSAPIATTVDVSRNPGYSFLAVLAVIIITIGLSLMALRFGAHVALFLQPYTPSISFLFGRRSVDFSVVFLACGCWLAALFMAIWPPDRPGGPVGDAIWMQETWRSQALFALVFAPLGCLLRFYASIHLNGRIKSFPLGTFAVNVFGTAMQAVFIDLQRVPIGGMGGCQVLQGMADGFCGCLTTVSTWVAELTALRLKHAYFYGMMSVGVALSLFVIITGSLQWKRGFAEPLCMH